MMNTLYLRVCLNGRDVVFPAAKVESVVNVDQSVAVPNVEPYIAGLFAMRSKVLTLIDCQWFITGQKAAIKKSSMAVVVDVGGHVYALLVDAVRDIFDTDAGIKELPSSPGAGWETLGSTILEENGEALLIIEPENLINVHQDIAA
ncbi:chemotaxis protein CheW [Parasphingorhabdus sp. DH2-15]|uniref:chemotaxis protein CheW n=1 Tax=Parasphingorhabdus sp. DH2-15 TaxID=3444112 RepID=UPI003F685E55